MVIFDEIRVWVVDEFESSNIKNIDWCMMIYFLDPIIYFLDPIDWNGEWHWVAWFLNLGTKDLDLSLRSFT